MRKQPLHLKNLVEMQVLTAIMADLFNPENKNTIAYSHKQHPGLQQANALIYRSQNPVCIRLSHRLPLQKYIVICCIK